MRIRLRYVYDKFSCIFHIEIPRNRNPHQIGSAAFALHHIGNGLLIEFRLCRHTDNKCAILYQSDGSMFQFSRCVGLRMDITDLLQFQAALQRNSIVQAPSDEKDVLRRRLFAGKPLDSLLILNNLLNFVRESLQFLYHSITDFFGKRPSDTAKIQGCF